MLVRYNSCVDLLNVHVRLGVPCLGYPEGDVVTVFKSKEDNSFVGFMLEEATENLDFIKDHEKLSDADKVWVLLEMLKQKHGKS